MSSLHTSTTSSNERRKSRRSTTKVEISSPTEESRTSTSLDNQKVIKVKCISDSTMALHGSDNEENDQTRHPKCQINPEEENTTSNHNLKPSHYCKKSKSKSILNSINMKAIRTTSMILGAFYICWSPFLIYMLVYHSNTDTSVNITAYYLAIVTQLNSLFNPILYGFRHLEIKQAIRKLFKCSKCCKNDLEF